MRFDSEQIAGTVAVAVLTAVLTVSAAVGGDWHRWRGPNLNGVSDETAWTDRWPEKGPAIAWKAEVGTGFSSVSLSKGRLYTMGNKENTDTVYCLDAESGKTLWTHSYESPLDARFFDGGPTSTPTVDENSVYTLGRQGNLFCFDAASGKVRWSKDLHQEAGIRIPGWGFSGSPLVHENLLLLTVGEAGTAVEKTTGKIVWTSQNNDAGYATPVPFRQGDRWLALIASGRFFAAVDIQTGEELWRHRWLTRFGANAADAILAGDRVLLSSGYNRGTALLKINGAEPQVVWETKEMQNQMNPSVLIDGYVYGIDGNTTSQAELACLELETGQIQWRQAGIGSGSLMAANGKLIVLSDRGELIVAKASPRGFEPLARAQVLSGTCWTVPVLAQGRIYCRNSDGELVCVDVRTR